jgi:hypothetical protein
LLKVLTKSGTNFGHFAGTDVNKMKTRDNLCSERPYSQSLSIPTPILNKNVKKFEHKNDILERA